MTAWHSDRGQIPALAKTTSQQADAGFCLGNRDLTVPVALLSKQSGDTSQMLTQLSSTTSSYISSEREDEINNSYVKGTFFGSLLCSNKVFAPKALGFEYLDWCTHSWSRVLWSVLVMQNLVTAFKISSKKILWMILTVRPWFEGIICQQGYLSC